MIKISNLCKKYDENVAVNIENLQVNKGEIFGFLGVNGAGKTTTIKMMVGLLTPTKGTILIDGEEISKNPKESKKKFAYIPDEPNVYDKLTGREFIRFIANLYGRLSNNELEDDIDKILETLSLKEKADNLINTYSHGMKQKIQIASALIHNPELLILDEPFTGLDPSGIKILKDILKDYSKEGKSIFISTHVLDIVENLCDRIAILNKGVIKFIGTVEKLRGSENLETSFLEFIKAKENED